MSAAADSALPIKYFNALSFKPSIRRAPTKRRLDVWSAYQLGLRTKTGGTGSPANVAGWALRRLHQLERLSWLFTPIDFVRYREFDFVLRSVAARGRPFRTILDLSSPKLLPLTLAHQFPDADVVSTDLLDHEVAWVAGKASSLRLANLKPQREDARKLSFDANTFDLITSVSVFEHIAPESDGDAPAITELARVLAPGGIAIITVPCSRTYHADYQFGAVYERQGGDRPIFFQRFYTPAMLQQRFVDQSGLELCQLRYIDERLSPKSPRRRVAHWINCSPTQTRLFGPMYPLLSHIFLSPPRPLERCAKPYIACMVLQKPLTAPSIPASPQLAGKELPA